MSQYIVIAGVLLASYVAAGLLPSGGEAVRADTIEALYVFGDSYVDTGNIDPDLNSSPWCYPYGSTWPGNGTGRFSDGRVLTDYIGCYLGVSPPSTFRSLNLSSEAKEVKTQEKHPTTRVEGNCSSQGINFAYGGSGVFTTANGTVSNVTTQIEDLKIAINNGCVPSGMRSYSVVLFAINGNDYIAFLEEHLNVTDQFIFALQVADFIIQVIQQMAVDIKDLLNLGFKNFYITNLGPVDKYPIMQYYPQLIPLFQSAISLHNTLLNYIIADLEENFANSSFLLLDLHTAFTSVLQEEILSSGPCITNESGIQYAKNAISCPPTNLTVCSNVDNTLFWDIIHPTQIGWFTLLNSALSNFSGCNNLWKPFVKI